MASRDRSDDAPRTELGVAFGGASGAAPAAIRSAAYLGECCGGDYYEGFVPVAKLRVASDGHSLVGGSRGSYIGCYRDGGLVALRPGQAVQIRRDGSFSFSGQRRARSAASLNRRLFKFSVRGRFTSPDRARIVYSVSPGPWIFGCRSGPQVLKLHRRTGEPPFTGCASQAGVTIISNAQSRVFQARRTFGYAFLPYAYGCMYSVDQRVAFGVNGFNEGYGGQALEQFRLAGPYVAYACGGNLDPGCWVAVRVFDLRDGSEHSPILSTSLGGGFGHGVPPSDVELKENGSVAWIAGYEEIRREVGALDTNGQRLLDSGRRIDPDSLQLNGSTLTWTNDGSTRSTNLD